MELIIAWVIGLILGAGIGGLIERHLLSTCKHNYKLIINREILRVIRDREALIGFIKVYECEHCKKMKKEQIEVNG